MNHDILLGTLDALYLLGRAGVSAEAGVIARRLGVDAIRVGRALVHLERRGLVDASRARLTMRGLAVAVGLRAQRAGGVRESTEAGYATPSHDAHTRAA